VERRWLVVALGLAVAAVGVGLTLRPFTSLSVLVAVVAAGLVVTGVVTAWRGRASSAGALVAVGLGWVAAGVVAVAWPSVTVRAVAVLVGALMIGDGALDVAAGLRGSRDHRPAAVIGGAASIVFGLLALAWPDVTLLVVAVVFGARTVLFGLRTAWSGFRDRGGVEPDDRLGAGNARYARNVRAEAGRLRRAGHLVGVSVALVVALLLAALSVAINRGVADVDAFYDTPADVPGAPGSLLDAEPYERDLPEGARGFRVLYTTTREDGVAAVASALVIAPAAAHGPLPVVAWAHGTTGFARRCAPSVMDAGLGAGAFYVLDEVLAQGWALVATDYTGLGTEGPHPYLIGEGEARSVLDAVRASRAIEGVDLADETVVWGHSQGGGAALWTGRLAPSYAPDVEIVGVAALAPAADLPGLVENLMGVRGGSLFAGYVVAAYTAAYDELSVGDLVRSSARPSYEAAIDRCLDASVLASALTSIATGTAMFTDDVAARLAPRLAENTPAGPFPMPVLVAQGADDSLITRDVQDRYVAGLCAAGAVVDYRVYDGRDHVPLVEPDSPLIPELVAWTAARLGSQPVDAACPSA